MNDTTDRPTIGERYSTATESSNLKLKEASCDADVLIAAGWAHEEIGAMLVRLQSEFDSAKAEIRGQGATALVDRVLILSKLKSLPATKQALGRWAVRMATKKAFMKPDGDVLRLAGRALDVFLDPNCHHCEGRGKNGGYGQPEVICKHCRGTGKRDSRKFGQDEADRAFVRFLLCGMDASAEAALRSMRRLLRRSEQS